MNGHNEELKTINNLLKQAETVRLNLYYQAKRLKVTMMRVL